MLRGAIIGFGQVAENGHWPAYREFDGAQIVAVVDRTESRRAAARQSIPHVATFATPADLAAGLEIDFVDVCTPPAWHSESMLEALSRGWNVICEKPMFLDLIDIEKVRSAMRESGRVAVPVHNWKYAPIVRHGAEILASGAIGPLHRVEIETLRIQDCAVADPEHQNWRRDPAIAGGGVLMDHGWHAIYLALHWFGQKPIEVEASLRRSGSGDAEDEATLKLAFPTGEAKIFVTWRAKKRRNIIRLIGARDQIAINDDTLVVGGDTMRFERALSAGSHHADWFETMLPDLVATFDRADVANELFEEAALCLSIIRQAYSI
jgi:predicted dehydrogenase